jgi:nucleotide-binding universal stress UspA family protein
MTGNRVLVAISLPLEPYEIRVIAAAATEADWSPHLFHVVRPHVAMYVSELGTYVPPPATGTANHVVAVEEVVAELAERGIESTFEVVVGSPVDEILRAAGAIKAQLIVTVAKPHHLVHRIVLGSVLASLLKAADRPVLVLPAEAAAEAGLAGAIDRFIDVAERQDDVAQAKEMKGAAEAHRVDPKSDEANHRLRGVVEQMQLDHPDLLKAANDISYFLSGMGI